MGRSSSPIDKGYLFQEYRDLVAIYSRRQLSFESDKFHAFSGLARRLHPYLGDYVAGCWVDDIKAGLLWFPDLGFCRHVEKYRAPSWSWASTDDRVLWYHVSQDPLPSSSLQMRLVDYTITPRRPGDLFGEVINGHLVVDALMFPLGRSSQITNAFLFPMNTVGDAYYDDPEEEDDQDEGACKDILEIKAEDGLFYLVSFGVDYSIRDLDCLEPDMDKLSRYEYKMMLVHLEDEVEGSDARRLAKCLILLRVDDADEDVYKRVGLAILHDPEPALMAGWMRKIITLV
ncbi:hypothetical protein OQA88_9478 [Cercophora sp. LCS_1]